MALLAGGPVVAQDDEQSLTEKQAAVNKERRTFIADALKLKGNEAERFWKVFDEYEKQLTETVQVPLMELIKDFEKSNATMTDEKAEELVNRWFDLVETRLNLRWDYFKKFKKALPASHVARFYQIENHLSLVNMAELVETLPFINPEK
jgi:hypothetical protein